jgi:hypothetical protein
MRKNASKANRAAMRSDHASLLFRALAAAFLMVLLSEDWRIIIEGSSLRIGDVLRQLSQLDIDIPLPLVASPFARPPFLRRLLTVGLGFLIWSAGVWGVMITLDRFTWGYRRGMVVAMGCGFGIVWAAWLSVALVPFFT